MQGMYCPVRNAQGRKPHVESPVPALQHVENVAAKRVLLLGEAADGRPRGAWSWRPWGSVPWRSAQWRSRRTKTGPGRRKAGLNPACSAASDEWGTRVQPDVEGAASRARRCASAAKRNTAATRTKSRPCADGRWNEPQPEGGPSSHRRAFPLSVQVRLPNQGNALGKMLALRAPSVL